ncbi:MAG: hypothetical protein GXO70_02715 [Acidobacteria bacterium]|nr:hypothetical protein [Acidobacteriota bacterium]
MAIRWVINGYFRSGTTFLWERFREATNGEVLCLYEPLHPDLPVFLENDGLDKSGRRLHQLDLWSDYLRIPSGQREFLLKRHPNRSGNCSWNHQELTDYLQILHGLNKDVMIQANRLHYDLPCVVELTDARIVHIVRNPLDVFHSIRHTYFTNPRLFRGFARRMAYPCRGNHAFETAAWFSRAAKKSPKLSTVLIGNPWGLLPWFVPAWVIANYSAVQAITGSTGMLCAYEEIFLRPAFLAKALETHLGTPFPIDRDDVRARSRENREKGWRKFNRWVKRWGLETEWNAIRKVSESRGVTWE